MIIYDKINVVLEQLQQEFGNKSLNLKVEFEGPYLALYTNDTSLLTGETGIIPKIAKLIRKKIIVRPLPEIRVEKEKAKEIIKQKVPKEAGLDEDNIYFDETKGEIHLYFLKPGLLKTRGNLILWELTNETKWRIIIHRKPAIESDIIRTVDHIIYSNSNEIHKIHLDIGMKINRENIKDIGIIRVTPLGAANEVGRSSFLVSTESSNILLDTGLKPGAKTLYDEFPVFYLENFIENLDCVIISHAHFDHCAALPYLFKYGYRGPVYMTEPTKYLMTLIIKDYLNILQKEGRYLPYSISDLHTALTHVVTLDYGEVVDIAPNIKLTLYNAGHILGSSIVHLHFGEGFHNLIYTGDFKFAKTRLLEQAFHSFKRNETVIMEGTYGDEKDIMPSRTEATNQLLNYIKITLEKNGIVLMPMLAVGRAQEILLTIFEGMESGQIPKVPVFVEGMIHETTAIHMSFLEELSQEIKEKVFKEGINPFTSEYFHLLKDNVDKSEIIEVRPSIIIATSGMLTGGPALEYFKLLAEDERNSIIFTSYQVQNTLGRKLQENIREVYVPSEKGEELIKVKLQVYSAEGFSGHSDRNQLLNYIRSLPTRPKQVILCHGEPSKLLSLSQAIRKDFHIFTYIPEIGETIKVT